MGDINTIAKQFVDFYYQTFSQDRAGLKALYVCLLLSLSILNNFLISLISQREHSMLTWEGSPIQGATAITEKIQVCCSPTLERAQLNLRLFQSLPFQKVQHKVTTLDAQPSSPSVASLLVSVTGLLVVRRK